MAENEIATEIPGAVFPVMQEIQSTRISAGVELIVKAVFPVYARKNATNYCVTRVNVFLQTTNKKAGQWLNYLGASVAVVVDLGHGSLRNAFKNANTPALFGFAAELAVETASVSVAPGTLVCGVSFRN